MEHKFPAKVDGAGKEEEEEGDSERGVAIVEGTHYKACASGF